MALNESEFLNIKQIWDTYDTRVLNSSLTVDAAYEMQVATKIRVERNALLRATDYTQIADSTPDSNDWLSYRMTLRNIPQQPGFPFTVTCPSVPEPDVVEFQAFQYLGDGTTLNLNPQDPI